MIHSTAVFVFGLSILSVAACAQAPRQPHRGVLPKELVNALAIHPDQTRVVVKLAEQHPGLTQDAKVIDAAILAVIAGRPIGPFFRGLQDQLAAISARQFAAAPPGSKPAVDLALYFEATARNADDARELVHRLNALPTVELAYARELPTRPPGDIPPLTPDFTASQGYRAPAPSGIGAAPMLWVGGASGSSVRVLDIEWGWDFGHEDIAGLLASALVGPPISQSSYNNHGTAVSGILAADADRFGVTGLTPDVTLRLATDYPASGYSVANAIVAGLPALETGDVMLLEAQISTPLGLGPTEWVQADFDAIFVATLLGITTVEAGGNGGVNLDSPVLGGAFNINIRDSGAIIVGASDGPALTRASWSSYGSRVNANGWGVNVVTTGYGDLFSVPGTVLQNYTNVFGGTSGASPMVTAAVVALRGAAESQLSADGGASLDAFAIRDLLETHGTPIPGIGRRPDTTALLAAANVLRGLSQRNEAALGATCFLDLVPIGAGADLYALLGGPMPANLELPAPFLPDSRLLLDLATAVPVTAGTFGATPASYSLAVPNDPMLRGQSFYFQAVTMQLATSAMVTTNNVRVFVRT